MPEREHHAKGVLRGGIALVSGLSEPGHGLRVVLRRALAFVVHLADRILRLGFPLPGQRTPKPQRLRVVATLKRGLAIFKLSCRRDAEQDERENAAGKREM